MRRFSGFGALDLTPSTLYYLSMHLNIPEVLASSSPLTEAERAYLNQLLDTSNDEISRLTAAIDKLVLEREKLQSNVMAYKAVLAPIRLLPEDMLREIFVNCLPSNKPADIAITDAPLLLGRICRSWRELVLSTPELWASIHVHFLHPFDTIRVQRLNDEAQAWIARSGTCPLTIAVTYRQEDPIVVKFIDYLTKLSKRWSSLEIGVPLGWLPSLASLSEDDVPRLERFRYFVTGMRHIETDPLLTENLWQSMGILGGKQLQDISLQNPWLQDSVAAISKINFGQLTRLDLNAGLRFTSMDAADILRRCPSLIGCRMAITGPQSANDEWKFEPLTLLHLTSFTIDLMFNFPSDISSTDVVFKDFFSSLDLPKLTSFNHNMGQCISWITLILASPIENLTLSISDLGNRSILEYLRTSTSLKRVQLSTWHHSLPDGIPGNAMDQLARLMAIDDANDIVCPFLEVLDLPNFGFPEQIFVQLVQRRAAVRTADGKPQLKTVRANFYRDLNLDVLSQLDDLVASGLSLSISYQRLLKPQNATTYWPCQLPELEWP
ncbi:hypothetical protein C8J56DRAFT_482830 [Mycena floridula]|nr:hypothetical protein C8J56DRAFT_482830 [Mycena floridula]